VEVLRHRAHVRRRLLVGDVAPGRQREVCQARQHVLDVDRGEMLFEVDAGRVVGARGRQAAGDDEVSVPHQAQEVDVVEGVVRIARVEDAEGCVGGGEVVLHLDPAGRVDRSGYVELRLGAARADADVAAGGDVDAAGGGAGADA